jgi:hypothetical protein
MNVTEPVGAEPVPEYVTVAVKVTKLPYVDVGDDETRPVVVAAGVTVRVPFTKLKL